MVPELKGNPSEFTIKISVFAKKAKVYGSRNLKINNKIATIMMLAIIKFFTVTVLYFLKKYNNPIDGIAKIDKKCTPKQSPITKENNTNHLFPLGVSNSSSHFKPSQTNTAINNEPIAYTSASTALYQKLSVKVKLSAAIIALP